jgi:2-dehydro-3-deoxygalactonokinase
VSNERILLFVDMGTTRTRVWRIHGKEIHAHASGDFGARDISTGKTVPWLRTRLVELLRQVSREDGETPEAVLAAGMITSNVGLREIEHIQAPADAHALAAKVAEDELALDDSRVLPLLLVPGVRTGAVTAAHLSALEMDLMRGEETLCIGLIERGYLKPGATLLTLGSHWKMIWTNERAQIVRSSTALTGEVIHAVQAHTLLASSLPQEQPQSLDDEWVDAGFTESARSGLGHALFAIRLLHFHSESTAHQRLAFLYGAFLQAQLSQMDQFAARNREILVAGSDCVAKALMRRARKAGIDCKFLQEPEREDAYLSGLRLLYEHRLRAGRPDFE